jgi:hypothetical protein
MITFSRNDRPDSSQGISFGRTVRRYSSDAELEAESSAAYHEEENRKRSRTHGFLKTAAILCVVALPFAADRTQVKHAKKALNGAVVSATQNGGSVYKLDGQNVSYPLYFGITAQMEIHVSKERDGVVSVDGEIDASGPGYRQKTVIASVPFSIFCSRNKKDGVCHVPSGMQ